MKFRQHSRGNADFTWLKIICLFVILYSPLAAM